MNHPSTRGPVHFLLDLLPGFFFGGLPTQYLSHRTPAIIPTRVIKPRMTFHSVSDIAEISLLVRNPRRVPRFKINVFP